MNSSGQDTLLLGTSSGQVLGWDVHENGTVEDRMNMQLSDSVHGLLLADCCSGGSNDLWVIEGDHLRIFMGSSLLELTRSLEVGGNASRVPMALHNIDNPQSRGDDALLLMEQNGEWSSMNYEFLQSDVSVLFEDLNSILIALFINWNDDCSH